MQTKQPLNDEQERRRIEGLRTVARIIARRVLAHEGRGVNSSAGERPDMPSRGGGARRRRKRAT